MALNFNDIKQVQGFEGQFVKEFTPKSQIVLHHTVSGPGVNGDLSWWKQTKSRIATAVVIARDGVIHQCFSTKYWAYHIGCVGPEFRKLSLPYRKCDPNSIGVELDSWGAVIKHQDKFYPVKWDNGKHVPWIAAGEVKPENIQLYSKPFRGFYYFEKYTEKQLNALRDLLEYWNQYWNIPLDYNAGMWDINKDALEGKPGVYTHVSYRSDKSDCHPQPELIQMLKSLSNG
jgi:N-acetyl-anhydromuramyl-L-alanine amidase AmpD